MGGLHTGLQRLLSPGSLSESPIWDGTLPGISWQCLRILKFFLLGSSRKRLLYPIMFPSYEENEVTFEDHCIPAGGWGQGNLCSCRSQISAVGLESGIRLCAGIRCDALISWEGQMKLILSPGGSKVTRVWRLKEIVRLYSWQNINRVMTPSTLFSPSLTFASRLGLGFWRKAHSYSFLRFSSKSSEFLWIRNINFYSSSFIC